MTKLPAQTQAEFCSTLVDEWARAGVRSAVISPGSRSAPMALALVADSRFTVHVRLDERSAGFMALGIGLASGMPAVVLTTSGTAAAEIHPAVVEADLARVPVIVCTADRPPELQNVGAPQTIKQAGLYGASVRWSLEAGVPGEEARSTWRSLGSRIVAEAVAGPAGPGPVHVNLAFREPLLPPAGSPVDLPPGRSGEAPWHGVIPSRRAPARRQMDDLSAILTPRRRGVIVAGAGCGDPSLVGAAAANLGWPLLADPRSGCRRAEAAGAVVVAAADALLRDDAFRAAHMPEVVLRLGEPWASKVLAGWFAESAAGGTLHVVTDPYWAWHDPGREAALHIPCHPDELLAALLAEPGDAITSHGAPSWSTGWAAAEEAAQRAIDTAVDAGETAQRAIDTALSAGDELTEPFIARYVFASEGVGTIVVASSMPVRDLEWFAKAVRRPPRVLSNRGANGIDGVCSTTMGVASAGTAEAGVTVGILGDLAFLHDLTAFVSPESRERLAPCVLVVVDNHGGGIFSFLPQATEVEADRFERLFGTPQRPDPASVARGLGARVMEAGTRSGFSEVFAQAVEAARNTETDAGPGPVVIIARTDRARNVEVHSELNAAVRAALARLAGG